MIPRAVRYLSFMGVYILRFYDDINDIHADARNRPCATSLITLSRSLTAGITEYLLCTKVIQYLLKCSTESCGATNGAQWLAVTSAADGT